jgi:Uma2 family endonuclease
MSIAPPTVKTGLLTAEEYADLADSSRCTELVRGRIVEMTPPKPRHGLVSGTVYLYLRQFADARQLGRVFSNDTGVITERDPDTVRGADVSFYSFARYPAEATLDEYPPGPPELVIEVKSPTDRWTKIAVKVAEYLNVGVDVVCVLDPERRNAIVHESDAPPLTLSADETLEFPTILPGFSIRVGQLFE